MSLPSRTVCCGLLAALTLPLHAHAQRARLRAAATATIASPPSPPPIELEVASQADTLRWAFSLHNTSSQSVEVPLDRRLLWLEITPAAPVETALGPHRRRARPLRPAHCIAMNHPGTTESSPRVTLAAGARRTEGFDLRDVCGLHLPRAFAPGASVTMHYGYRIVRGHPSFGHAVVFDGAEPATGDLVAAPITVPGDATSWPPAPPAADLGDASVHVTAGGALSGTDPMGVRITARVRQAGAYPMHTFFRPDQFRVLTLDPAGHPTECGIGPRGYAPIREFFVPLTRRAGPAASLVLGEVCDPALFTMAGTYRAQVVYTSSTDGQEFGYRTFLGTASSPYFFFRIARVHQAARYRPLSVDDPFARDAASATH